MPEKHSLAAAPDFRIHRENVGAADPAIGSLPAGIGIDSKGYDEIAMNLIVGGGTPSFDLEVLFKSPNAPSPGWLVANPAITFAGVTTSRRVTFRSGGQRFLVRVSAATGTNPTLTVEVAGIVPRQDEYD